MTPQPYLLMLLLVSLAACGKSGDRSIEITNAWSPAAPPGASVIAVYADLSAHHSDTLTAVSTPIAGSAQIHSTSEENGMMRMRSISQLELKQGEIVHLEPGGMHLMLSGLRQVPMAGTNIPLTFHFAKAGDITVTVIVRPTG